MPRTHPPTRGFTLVELLVVMSLMMILTSVAMTQYGRSVTYAREAVLRENLFRMRDAIDQYDADKGEYPPTLDALVTEQYVRKVPLDPLTRDSNSWLVVRADVDPRSPRSSPGIYDIKSGADGVALDGSRYGGW